LELATEDPPFIVSRRVRDLLANGRKRRKFGPEAVDAGLGGATRIVLVGDDAKVDQVVPGRLLASDSNAQDVIEAPESLVVGGRRAIAAGLVIRAVNGGVGRSIEAESEDVGGDGKHGSGLLGMGVWSLFTLFSLLSTESEDGGFGLVDLAISIKLITVLGARTKEDIIFTLGKVVGPHEPLAGLEALGSLLSVVNRL